MPTSFSISFLISLFLVPFFSSLTLSLLTPELTTALRPAASTLSPLRTSPGISPPPTHTDRLS